MGISDIRVKIQTEGVEAIGTLKDVLYVPALGINLFSISAATTNGMTAHFHDDKV